VEWCSSLVEKHVEVIKDTCLYGEGKWGVALHDATNSSKPHPSHQTITHNRPTHHTLFVHTITLSSTWSHNCPADHAFVHTITISSTELHHVLALFQNSLFATKPGCIWSDHASVFWQRSAEWHTHTHIHTHNWVSSTHREAQPYSITHRVKILPPSCKRKHMHSV
jgi:hypothetical protein